VNNSCYLSLVAAQVVKDFCCVLWLPLWSSSLPLGGFHAFDAVERHWKFFFCSKELLRRASVVGEFRNRFFF